MTKPYQIPNLNQPVFARTNIQTIKQRISILKEILPSVDSIAEICCGDCQRQWQAYQKELGITSYKGLDLHPEIVKINQQKGIDCIGGDALAKSTMQQFQDFEVIFFGPPLSVDCDTHRLLGFSDVIPSYKDFMELMLNEIGYQGIIVCICPKTTTIGDIQWLYDQVKSSDHNWGLRLIHHSYSTLTGQDLVTESRLKYLELWFSNCLEDSWEMKNNEQI